MIRTYLLRIFSLAVFGVLTNVDQQAAEEKRLTLTEAVQLAVSQNRDLKIARLRVEESVQKKAQARSSYFPEIKNHSTFLRTTSLENLEIPAGAFGQIPNIGAVPYRNVQITQGSQTFEASGTGLAQPLTQLIRIRQTNRIAAFETASTRDEVKKAENEVAVKVHELYFSILVTRLQKGAADQEVAREQVRLREESERLATNQSQLGVVLVSARQQASAASYKAKAGMLQAQLAHLLAGAELEEAAGRTPGL